VSAGWGTRAWFEAEFRAAGAAADPWGHEWRASQRVRHERLARLTVPWLAGGGRAVLDVGCAYGALTARLAELNPGGRVLGLDLSEQAVRVARRRLAGQAQFVVAALPDLPLAAGQMDLAVAAETLYYLPGAARVAAAAVLRQVLKPGGLLLFSTVLDDGTRYFTPASAQALLASACLAVQTVDFGHDAWYTRLETPWLTVERRLGRGLRVLEDEAEFAAWRAGRSGGAARLLSAVRRSPHLRGLTARGLRVGRALLCWVLGWRWPVMLLAFICQQGGWGRSEVVILARRREE
jgi:SAM-dependent methyltransferase